MNENEETTMEILISTIHQLIKEVDEMRKVILSDEHLERCPDSPGMIMGKAMIEAMNDWKKEQK